MQGREHVFDGIASVGVLDLLQHILPHDFRTDVIDVDAFHGVGIEILGLAVLSTVTRGTHGVDPGFLGLILADFPGFHLLIEVG